MTESFHEYVVTALQGCSGTELEQVAAATEISKSTLLKIRSRWIANPGVQSIEVLYRYFKGREATPAGECRPAA